jgi:hypothetical protein
MSTIEDLYQKRARRHDDGSIRMNGVFKTAPTYSGFTFQPDDDGESTVVVPVYDSVGLIDVVAIEGNVYGAVTGAASHLGTGNRVHKTPAEWLAADDGVLVLSKSFLPMLQMADSIIADDAEHGEQSQGAFGAAAVGRQTHRRHHCAR